jgi:endonuclease-3
MLMKPSTYVRRKILEILEDLYPSPQSELYFSNEYELVIAVVLSAQCTDKKVNEATPALFARYASFAALSQAKVEDTAQIIRTINYYKTKARHIVALARKVVEEHEGKLPKIHDKLVELPGVGRKTANVVLSELGVVPTFPVDTHVYRVSKRLGFATGGTPLQVEDELKELFAPSVWRLLHHWLILHGRRTCTARSPQCNECLISKYCPSKSFS